ncbi:MAG: hypothetical protein A2945_00795 [Candidatus Liptonbacteria bacterium RIFCSPLOWO2_01_FULL_52_25]|uniref:Type II secretion system protein GspG C-terminal domain-containing protein n=1 Tax=Candidatus Liptonbacteria bacterium RIFCSPLOWO2_01_FULL_52_25 TaxID=1798650 RepID=A0A1G2CF57_9BACT|nr:MAG: hypothetical protein A2945_00795 [Candidatus Liptonbacteria bacterium RIFCSPLOWO2_01_FULL_52_25]
MYQLGKNSRKGFTLLELLVVIAIIAILSVILILVLDPAETLKKSRDAQRISDLNTVKTAIGIYSTGTSTVYLGGPSSNLLCKTGAGAGSYPAQSATVHSVRYSAQSATITALVDVSASTTQLTIVSSTLTNGEGWAPVNFDGLVGGSPISNLPLDPTNSVTAVPASTDRTYRYTCNASTTKWEADAALESDEFTINDNKRTKDGGNNSNYYEVGTSLQLLGTGTDF